MNKRKEDTIYLLQVAHTIGKIEGKDQVKYLRGKDEETFYEFCKYTLDFFDKRFSTYLVCSILDKKILDKLEKGFLQEQEEKENKKIKKKGGANEIKS